MAVMSAGILLYRLVRRRTEVLIAHMGGPYWAAKDAAAWSIPKGEYDPDYEAALDAALREFGEELGVPAPTCRTPSSARSRTRRASGSRCSSPTERTSPLDDLVFGEFELEWPPRSGTHAVVPRGRPRRVDRLDAARERLVKGQRPALDALEKRLAEVAD